MSEENKSMTIKLSGRINSENVAKVEEDIWSQLEGQDVSALHLDASELEYISSAGLRAILRLRKAYSDLTVENVSPEVYEIFDVTGFTEMFTVKKAYRVVSVEGCEVIGEGANGKVYRIDRDNVVKTYKNADALGEIEHEREVAKLALILGVPTAISYDVARVGDSYGSVFELLNSRSFAKILATEPERFDWCVKEYSDLMKLIHSIEVPEGKLPRIKEKGQRWAASVAGDLPGDYGEKLLKLIDGIPERNTMIHGDFHTKNIVLAGDEVMLIDMDTLSVGHPIFELAQIYTSFVGFGEYDPHEVSDFMGFSAELAREFWKKSLIAYLGTDDEGTVTDVENKVRCVSYARLIDWNRRHRGDGSDSDRKARELWTRELLELLDKLDTLVF